MISEMTLQMSIYHYSDRTNCWLKIVFSTALRAFNLSLASSLSLYLFDCLLRQNGFVFVWNCSEKCCRCWSYYCYSIIIQQPLLFFLLVKKFQIQLKSSIYHPQQITITVYYGACREQVKGQAIYYRTLSSSAGRRYVDLVYFERFNEFPFSFWPGFVHRKMSHETSACSCRCHQPWTSCQCSPSSLNDNCRIVDLRVASDWACSWRQGWRNLSQSYSFARAERGLWLRILYVLDTSFCCQRHWRFCHGTYFQSFDYMIVGCSSYVWHIFLNSYSCVAGSESLAFAKGFDFLSLQITIFDGGTLLLKF